MYPVVAIIGLAHHRVMITGGTAIRFLTDSIPLGNTLHLHQGQQILSAAPFPTSPTPPFLPLHPKFILSIELKGSAYASRFWQAYKTS